MCYAPHSYGYVRGPAPLLGRGGSAPGRTTAGVMTQVHTIETRHIHRHTIVNSMDQTTVLARRCWRLLCCVGLRLSREVDRRGASVRYAATTTCSSSCEAAPASWDVDIVAGSLCALWHHQVNVHRAVVGTRWTGGRRRRRHGGRRRGGHGRRRRGHRCGWRRRARTAILHELRHKRREVVELNRGLSATASTDAHFRNVRRLPQRVEVRRL